MAAASIAERTWLTPKEVRELTGIPESTLRRWALKEPEFKEKRAWRWGRRGRLFKVAACQRFLELERGAPEAASLSSETAPRP